MKGYTGGCQCGALRYSIQGELGEAGICHCRMCQKAFGSWGAALVKVPLSHFEWTRGAASTFMSSSIVERGFCAACGTPMFMHEAGDTNIEIAIGTLDNPNAIGPMTSQDGVESRVAWFNQIHNLPARRTDQTMPGADWEKLKSRQHPDHDTANWPLK